jgi:hypothetical protein
MRRSSQQSIPVPAGFTLGQVCDTAEHPLYTSYELTDGTKCSPWQVSRYPGVDCPVLKIERPDGQIAMVCPLVYEGGALYEEPVANMVPEIFGTGDDVPGYNYIEGRGLVPNTEMSALAPTAHKFHQILTAGERVALTV